MSTRMGETGTDRLAQVEDDLRRLREEVAQREQSQVGLVELLMRDISKREETARRLEAAQSWIQLAQETGGVAAYSMEAPAGPLTWSASTFPLYGINPAEEPSLDLWLSRIHEEDRASVRAVAEAALLTGAQIDHEFRVVHPNGEIRWIADRGRVLLDHHGRALRVIGLNIDITQLKHAQDALLVREEEYRLTFERAAVGLAHVGLDGTFLKLNTSLANMLGYDKDELSRLTFQDITHPDDLAEDLAELSRLIAGEVESYELEKRYYRKDGSILWASLWVSLKRRENGDPLHFISIVSDISARKAAEQRTDVLMREMMHRANNMFTVVHALIQQTRRTEDDLDGFSQSLADRISGLAVSHDLLAGAFHQGASLEELASRQTSAFVRDQRGRLQLDGPEVRLGETATRILGMALHELGTNACKYGSLCTDGGEVHINWRTTEGEQPMLKLVWEERGGPSVAEPTRRGFGKRVLRDMVAQGLGGEVELTFPTTGVVWRVRCPVANLRN